MSDYIERELALRIIIQKQKELCPLGTYGKKYVDGYNREKFDEWQEIIDRIESVPAADVAEMKHGKWIEVQKENIWNDIVPVLECSACGKYTVGTRGIMTKSNYCPNCGAKMDLED